MSAVSHIVGIANFCDARVVLYACVFLILIILWKGDYFSNLPAIDAVCAFCQGEEIIEVVSLAAQDHHVAAIVLDYGAVEDAAAVERQHIGCDDGVARVTTEDLFF